MPIAARCPCGKRFVLAGSVFPRSVACHACGARTVVSSPTEFVSADGWRMERETSVPLDAAADPRAGVSETLGGVRCFVCRAPSFASCARCGRFYCARHGRERFGANSMCVVCYDRRRAGHLLAGIAAGLFALFCLYVALFVPGPKDPKEPYLFTFLPMAAGGSIASVVSIWFSARAYP
ncbi:MAG: hypothetical protein U0793_16375 [Gemmataceae bacterium]